MIRIRRAGMAQLQDEISDGLEAVADEVLRRAIPLVPVETGETRDSLHTDKTGAGFFVHEGTVDTPAFPFLSMALDSVRSDIPGIMRRRR
jgi:hypothetical protein